MNHDILKRLGLDHLDVSSTDFLAALNRMQQQERDSLRESQPLNDPEFDAIDFDFLTGFDHSPQP
jgi:hypothetical protein